MIVKTRIQNKNDIEANWLKATNFTPLKGEVIIYNEDSTHDYKRVKVGDGKTLVSNLPFLNAELEAKISDLTTRLSALEALLNEDGYNVVLVKNNK